MNKVELDKILDRLTEAEESLEKMFVISNDFYEYFESEDADETIYFFSRWDASVRNKILAKEIALSRAIMKDTYNMVKELKENICAGANEQQEQRHESS